MWKWSVITLITIALVSCGRPSHWEIPGGIDHPPTEETPDNSNIDNSGNSSPTEGGSGSELAAVGSTSIVNLEPTLVRGYVAQETTPDNIQPGS